MSRTSHMNSEFIKQNIIDVSCGRVIKNEQRPATEKLYIVLINLLREQLYTKL